MQHSKTASSPLVGRASELAYLVGSLSEAGDGIVTVCGISGVGKTALVRAAAVRVSSFFPGGCSFVSLAEAKSLKRVAAELDETTGTAARLLVLDDVDGAPDEARADVAAAGRSPSVRVVVCSVLPMKIAGERVMYLRGLPVPPEGNGPAGRPAAGAVRLFERVLDESIVGAAHGDHRDDVNKLCREVGGLPLAVITAAAHSGGRTATNAAALLDQRPPAARIDPCADGRHESVRAALEWTYRRLEEHTRRMLRVLAVFSGGFTEQAALAVSDLDPRLACEALDTLTELGIVIPRNAEDAYDVPELFREYARRKLRWSRQEGSSWNRYISHLATIAREASLAEDDARDEDVPGAALLLQDDTLVALERLVASGREAEALQLASDLVRTQTSWLGPLTRLRATLDSLLRSVDPRPSPETAAALIGAAELAYLSLDAVDAAGLAVRRLETGIAMTRELDDPLLLLRALSTMVVLLPMTGNIELSRASAREARDLAERLGHYRWLARFEAWTGMIEHQAGDVQQAVEWGLAAQARARRNGDLRAQVLCDLLFIGLPEDVDVPGGRPPWRDAEEQSRKLRDRRFEAIALIGQAGVAAREGRLEDAAQLAARRLEIGRRAESWAFTGMSMMGLVLVAAIRGDPSEALHLHGCVLHRTTLLQSTIPPHRAVEYEALVDRLRAVVGQDAFDEAVRRGASMSWPEAETFAMDYANLVAAGAHRAVELGVSDDRAEDVLTAREWQVLELIAGGLSNREIAERIGTTTKSAMHHASTVYRKLGVSGRAEAIAWAFRHNSAPAPSRTSVDDPSR